MVIFHRYVSLPEGIYKAEKLLVGGFNPSEKYEFVSWDDYSQLNGKIDKNRTCTKMFQATNQYTTWIQSDYSRLFLLLFLSGNSVAASPSNWRGRGMSWDPRGAIQAALRRNSSCTFSCCCVKLSPPGVLWTTWWFQRGACEESRS